MCALSRAICVDLSASHFGFYSSDESELQIQIHGECLSESTGNCQPLIGFGDGTYYFIVTYSVGNSNQTVKHYPECCDPSNSYLAEGNVTTLLRKYNGTKSTRDRQFSDAVTDAVGFSSGSKEVITGSSWPIMLSIRNNQSVSKLRVNDGKPRYWISSFRTNTSLSLGILNRNRGAVVGFRISNITVDRIEPTVNPTSSPSITTMVPTENPTAKPTVKPGNDPTANPTTVPTENAISTSNTGLLIYSQPVITTGNSTSYVFPTNNSKHFGPIFLYFASFCTFDSTLVLLFIVFSKNLLNAS